MGSFLHPLRQVGSVKKREVKMRATRDVQILDAAGTASLPSQRPNANGEATEGQIKVQRCTLTQKRRRGWHDDENCQH